MSQLQHDPLAALLLNTDSRCWQVTLVPRALPERGKPQVALPADWAQGQVIHPQDQVSVLDCLRPLLNGTDELAICEYRAQSDHNEWRWFRLRAQREAAAEGEPPRLQLCASEITRQKRAERLLALQSRIVQQ